MRGTTKLPIVNITQNNLETVWTDICNDIKEASFISVDCELTGLGDRQKLNCSDIELRYKYISELVKSHAIISIGISCFRLKSVYSEQIRPDTENKIKSHNYAVRTYNILVQPDNAYTIEAISMKFLVNHGFDFNQLFSNGLIYHRGADATEDKPEFEVRQLFNLILKHKKPLVIHNGFIDLMYIYECFYWQLPKKIDTFAADLYDLFPNGIYDTKYITEHVQKLPATYLEYLYKTMLLENHQRQQTNNWHVELFPSLFPPSFTGVQFHDFLEMLSYSTEDDDDQLEICECYSFHGWCSEPQCDKSHNVNRMVKNSIKKHRKTRKQSKHKNTTSRPSGPSTVSDVIQRELRKMKNYSNNNQQRNNHSNNLFKAKLNNDNNDSVIANHNSSTTNIKNIENYNISDDNSSKNKSIVLEELFELSDEEFSDLTDNSVISTVNRTNNSDSNISIKERHSVSSNMDTSQSSPTLDQNKLQELCNGDTITISQDNDSKEQSSQAHTAGYDAFMTGFLFTCFVSMFGELKESCDDYTPDNIGMTELVNNVYLVGKSLPFLIRQGSYAKISSGHAKKIKTLRQELEQNS